MARIIYKKGFENQNKLECIEGIEIEMLNGQKALIYPKYSEKVMLSKDKIQHYDEEYITEIEALKETESRRVTEKLFDLESPAATCVAQFHSDKYSTFALPTLLTAMEIQYQRNDIDTLAATIEGTDLLRDFNGGIWSCSRASEVGGWFVNDCLAHAFYSNFCYSCIAVPIVLYR